RKSDQAVTDPLWRGVAGEAPNGQAKSAKGDVHERIDSGWPERLPTPRVVNLSLTQKALPHR
ncbi:MULTISPECIES: hypothetical protein, partial [Xanthobacteraceae]